MEQANKASYEEVVKLAEQLSRPERDKLIAHLQKRAQNRKLSVEEWTALLDSITVNTPVLTEPSNRREDWYGEDGR